MGGLLDGDRALSDRHWKQVALVALACNALLLCYTVTRPAQGDAASLQKHDFHAAFAASGMLADAKFIEARIPARSDTRPHRPAAVDAHRAPTHTGAPQLWLPSA